MLFAFASPQQGANAMPATSPINAPDHTTTGDLPDLIVSWRRHLAAQRMSAATLETYTIAACQLAAFLADQGMPTKAANIRREHVEAFVTRLLERWKPATAHN